MVTRDITLDISEPKLEDHAGMAALCLELVPEQAQGDLSPDALVKRCQGPRGVNLVARIDHQVVGLLLCGQTHQTRHDVEYLLVHPDHADGHVQRTLVDKLLVKLTARGIHTFQFNPQTAGSNAPAWQEARWQGHFNLQSRTPVGKQATCPLR